MGESRPDLDLPAADWKVKPAGATPTTVCGWRSMEIAFPAMAGSPPNCSFHKSWLRITTRSPFCSSCGRKPRPTSGCACKTANRSQDTIAPLRWIGSPFPDSVNSSSR